MPAKDDEGPTEAGGDDPLNPFSNFPSTPPGIAPDCGPSGLYWVQCVDWTIVKPEDAWGEGGLGYGKSRDECYNQGPTGYHLIAKCEANYDEWEKNESLDSQYYYDGQDDPTRPGIAPDCDYSGIYWPKCVDWVHVKPEHAWGEGVPGYGMSRDHCTNQSERAMIAKCQAVYDEWEMNSQYYA